MTSYNANLYPDAPLYKKRAGITAPKSFAGFVDNLWAGFNNLNVLLLPKRIHFIELEDQAFCPPFLRQLAQATLTAQWTHRLPILQNHAPATLAASLLQDLIAKIESGNRSKHPLEVVDFCAGAGGPSPYIEHEINMRRLAVKKAPINFVLTDLHPHIDAWTPLAEKSNTLNFIPQPVDAAHPPSSVISSSSSSSGITATSSARIMRTFYLSFHHFDDNAAKAILKSTLETSDAFAIIELMDRRLFSLLLLLLEPLLIYLVAPWWFVGDLRYLFFTFVIPLLPILMGWDGIVSLLRTRTFDEIIQLADSAMGWRGAKSGFGKFLTVDGGDTLRIIERDGWVFESGRRLHTFPLGYMHWVVGRRVKDMHDSSFQTM